MAKNKKQHKKIKIKLPLPPASAQPHEEVILVPENIVPEKVVPLPEAHGPVPCIATLFHGWAGDYIVLCPSEGHTLPRVSEDGTRVDVQFMPPALPPESFQG